MYEFVRKDQCTGITDGRKYPCVGVVSAIEQKGAVAVPVPDRQ